MHLFFSEIKLKKFRQCALLQFLGQWRIRFWCSAWSICSIADSHRHCIRLTSRPFAVPARRYRDEWRSGSYFSRHRWSCNFRSVAVKTWEEIVVLRDPFSVVGWDFVARKKIIQKRRGFLIVNGKLRYPDIILVLLVVSLISVQLTKWVLDVGNVQNTEPQTEQDVKNNSDKSSFIKVLVPVAQEQQRRHHVFQALLWRRLLWNPIGEEANFLPSITTCLESKAIRQAACCWRRRNMSMDSG